MLGLVYLTILFKIRNPSHTRKLSFINSKLFLNLITTYNNNLIEERQQFIKCFVDSKSGTITEYKQIYLFILLSSTWA